VPSDRAFAGNPLEVVERLLLKLEARDRLSAAEKTALADLVEREVIYLPGDLIVREGEPQTTSQLLLTGMAARSKLMADGGRQITELHIDGDFVDLHSFLLKELEHDVVALSPIRMAMVPHSRLTKITEDWPHLTRMLWLSTLLDAAIHREWIASAGRRSALERVANLFCEMMLRYRVVGLADRDRCLMPLTQGQLADTCGLTPQHVNRVVQELRGDGLIEWRNGELAILDFDGLAARAGFDPAYLVLGRRAR
jgi:CRP-like cAMP-binding protein